MSDLTCGSPKNRVRSCASLNTKDQCQPHADFLWESVNGQPYLCEWNNLMNKCVTADKCNCVTAPFELDSLGIHNDVPTECEHLTGDQCRYFKTSEGRNCVQTILGKCVTPPDTDPICTNIDQLWEFAAYNDECPFGTDKKCKDICRDRSDGGNPSFTGPASEVLSYPCFGFWSDGYGRYCSCSYPS